MLRSSPKSLEKERRGFVFQPTDIVTFFKRAGQLGFEKPAVTLAGLASGEAKD